MDFVFQTDNEIPDLKCPSIIRVPTAQGVDSSVVTFVVNATDNVDGVLDVTCNSTSGNTFFVGDTAVGCTSTDQAGNRAECSFIVRVEGMSYQGKKNAATYVIFVFLKTI